MKMPIALLAGLVFASACTSTLTVDRLDDDPAASACLEGVPNDCSLRGAVRNANARPGLDTVVLPSIDPQYPTSYTLAIPGADEDGAATGDLDVTDDLVVKGEPRTSELDGSELVPVISAYGMLDRIWDVDPSDAGVSLTVSDLVLAFGDVSGSAVFPHGGVIRNRPHGTLTLKRCTLFAAAIVAPTAVAGGVVFNQGLVQIHDSHVEGGLATRGGAIANGDGESALAGGAVSIDGTTIDLSYAVPPPFLQDAAGSFEGGAVYNEAQGTVLVERSTLTQNGAAVGGAIANHGELVVRESLVHENFGGTITPTGPTCGPGGGIANFGTLGLTNSTLTANTGGCAQRQADAGLHNVGQAVLQNVSLVDNGISNPSGTTELANTLIARSGCVGAGFASDGGNLEGPLSTCGLDQGCDLVGVANPNLGALAANGGPTRTHALLAGSPALDHGLALTCPATDQRGQPRSDGACDTGAFERTPADG